MPKNEEITVTRADLIDIFNRWEGDYRAHPDDYEVQGDLQKNSELSADNFLALYQSRVC